MAKGSGSKALDLKPVLPQGLRYDEEEKIATVTLDRPDRLNALTFEMYEGLKELFAWLKSRKQVRAVVLTGEGRGFCSGGDVEDIIGKLLRMKRIELERFTRLTCDVVENMRSCAQPIVAALNGTVAGAGAALAIASDIRIAAPEAKIAFLFVKAGLSAADMGACHLLPRIIGVGRATELLMTGDFIDAVTAERYGLYNRIVPKERLVGEAKAFARALAEGPQQGLVMSKWAINDQQSMTLGAALQYDSRIQADCMMHPDFQEAYAAFREKRRPKFL